ncbi:extracellular solute-binding protein [Ignisphaera sp. 4213-co]|uniref:Extracellular solute-binding protein n=1 Tax=Ignisphaera cupida TaxID=3050454 RepID=A0ABD4Z858_9CREN|nr:extracellular solute-binding protein [Ignisphaera sp. 4213-co]MDK6029531.1 extracellular solute-binding protein [Ignisphaera sp. 4213-co]
MSKPVGALTTTILLVVLIILSIISIALISTLPRTVPTVTVPITVPSVSVLTVTQAQVRTEVKTVTVGPGAGATVTTTVPTTVTVTGTLAAAPTYPSLEEWVKNIVAKYNLKGITIKMVTESTPTSLFIRDVLAPEFSKVSGINAIVETVSWDEMYRKTVATLQAKTTDYDVFYIEQDIVGQFGVLGWLEDLMPYLSDKELTWPGYDPADLYTLNQYYFRGKLLAIPFEAFLKIYVYRKDLFEKYGIKLPEVLTWDFVKNVAEFFGAGTKEPGVYGWVAQAASHPCLWFEMVESIWPTFGVHYWGISNDLSHVYFNNTCGKKAFRLYIELLKYAPPGVTSYTWDEVGATFTRGGAVQGLMYAEFFGTIFKQNPAMIGKYGVAYPPIDPACYKGGYIGYFDGGGMGINPYIPRERKIAAWLFIQWVTSKDSVRKMAEGVTTTIVRWSVIQELGPKLDEKYGYGYWALMMKAIRENVFRGAPPTPTYDIATTTELFTTLHKAVTGEMSPDEALDKAAQIVLSVLAKWRDVYGILPPYS